MTKPTYSGKQKAWLRGRAHPLRPVLRIGNAGITDTLLAEVDRALSIRELIKVRLASSDGKQEAAESLAARTSSTLCGLLGLTAILYRHEPEKAERGEDSIVPPADPKEKQG